MTNITQIFTYLFDDISDKRVKNWLLMDNPGPLLMILAAYFLFVLKLGPQFMEHRKPFNLNIVIRTYNIFQIVVCTIIIFKFSYISWVGKDFLFGCIPCDYSDNPRAVEIAEWVWWTCMLKVVELVETVFFVLRKKYGQVSGLHLYHHSSTAFVGWIGTKYIPGGMAVLPIIVNCFIHVLMYLYYYLSSLGPKWQKKLRYWKPKLTILQMVQFSFLIVHGSFAFKADCPVPTIITLIAIPDIILIYYLFFDFYKNTYMTKKKVK